MKLRRLATLALAFALAFTLAAIQGGGHGPGSGETGWAFLSRHALP